MIGRLCRESTTRLRHSSDTSMLPAGSLKPELLRMYKARRRACQIRLVGSRGACGNGTSSDKEARNGFICTTCDLDLSPTSPCYLQVAWYLAN